MTVNILLYMMTLNHRKQRLSTLPRSPSYLDRMYVCGFYSNFKDVLRWKLKSWVRLMTGKAVHN